MDRAQVDVGIPAGVLVDSVETHQRLVELRPLVAYSRTSLRLRPSVPIQVGERAFA